MKRIVVGTSDRVGYVPEVMKNEEVDAVLANNPQTPRFCYLAFRKKYVWKMFGPNLRRYKCQEVYILTNFVWIRIFATFEEVSDILRSQPDLVDFCPQKV